MESQDHESSPGVIAEMGQATGLLAQRLMSLRPGLTDIRGKLRLASTRQTTLVEDAAYPLLGIFSAIGLSAIYGEGEASLGRLLANVLTRYGDVSILTWTRESNPFNSCLPAHISVFCGPATSHLPLSISESEMERIVSGLYIPSFDLNMALRLYDRLSELPTRRFAESRMTLPCTAFQLPSLSASRAGSYRVYRADTPIFGMMEIRTRHALSRTNSLYLVHHWLDTLLEHAGMHGDSFMEDDILPPLSPDVEDEVVLDDEHTGEIDDYPSPPIVPIDKDTEA